MKNQRIIVNELFKSISGEIAGFPQGSECVFVRTAGCNLRCDFCDAQDTQQVNPKDYGFEIDELMENIKAMHCKNVVITGGEPLLQNPTAMINFVRQLDTFGFKVSIETNGSIFVPFEIVNKATIVMDFKMNYLKEMETRNFLSLKPTDYIKFVIGNGITMAMALNIQKRLYTRGCMAQFAYSPMLNATTPEGLLVEAREKASLILTELEKTNLQGILNIQIHKLLKQR